MQGPGRLVARSLRLSRAASLLAHTPRPPPALLVAAPVLLQQHRPYRRSAVVRKDDDDKRHKSGTGKAADKAADEADKKPGQEHDAKAVDQEGSSKEARTAEEQTSKRKGQKGVEDGVRPAIISRNQALSLVANSGNKSRVIVANHDHPETYPQCMALAMSGRPILPGFYSIPSSNMSLVFDVRIDLCEK